MDMPIVGYTGHNRSVTDLCFGYGHGELLLLTTSEDHTAIIRNGETGGFIHKFDRHEGPVWSCDTNPKFPLAATASEDCTVRIWNMITRESAQTYSEGNIMQSCAFSLDGEHILMGGFGGLKSYQLSGSNTPAWEVPMDEVVRCVAWIDEYRLAVSFSDKLGIDFYDTRTACLIHEIWTDSSVTSIELNKTKTLFTAVYGDKIDIGDARSDMKKKEMRMPCLMESASLRRQNDLLIAGGDNGLMYRRNFNNETTDEIECEFNKGPIQCVSHSPEGESYAVGFRDGSTIVHRYHVDAHMDEQMEEADH